MAYGKATIITTDANGSKSVPGVQEPLVALVDLGDMTPEEALAWYIENYGMSGNPGIIQVNILNVEHAQSLSCLGGYSFGGSRLFCAEKNSE